MDTHKRPGGRADICRGMDPISKDSIPKQKRVQPLDIREDCLLDQTQDILEKVRFKFAMKMRPSSKMRRKTTRQSKRG